MQWCRRREFRGCKRTPKSFGWSQIRAKSLKIRAKSLKLWTKFLKIWVKPLKILEKMATNVCRKTQKHMKTFFGGHTKKGLHNLCGRICRQKLYKNFSGKFGEIRAKILRTPKILPSPIPVITCHFWSV